MSDRVCVGAIAGAFGVRGEVRLKSFCADPAAIATYGPLETEDGRRRFDVTITRAVKQGFAARLSGVASKEAADGLRGVRLHAPRSALPAPAADEFYHADLLGLEAVDTDGRPHGRVTAVHEIGGADLLEVRGPGASGSVLVPFTRAIVPTIDLRAGRIVVDPPEGLFEG